MDALILCLSSSKKAPCYNNLVLVLRQKQCYYVRGTTPYSRHVAHSTYSLSYSDMIARIFYERLYTKGILLFFLL